MSLFKSEEEKQQANEEKTRKILAKYGLESINSEFAPQVKDIASKLVGVDLIEAGNVLGASKDIDLVSSKRLGAIMQQNWIIIRLLDQINKKLDK